MTFAKIFALFKTKKTKKITLITFSIFLVLLLCFFVFRNMVLQSVIQKAILKSAQTYHSKLVINDASFQGFSQVKIEQISFIPHQSDTLFHFQEIKIGISFWNALIGNVQVNELSLHNGFVQMIKNENGNNYAHLLKKQSNSQNQKSAVKKNFSKQVYNLVSKVLRLVPEEMSLKSVSFKYINFDKKTTFQINHLTIINQVVDSDLYVITNGSSQRWKIAGTANPRKEQADVYLYNQYKEPVRLPYLEDKYRLAVSFDSIRLNIQEIDKSGSELAIKGAASIVNLSLNHPRISSKDVQIKNAGINYDFLLGSDFITMDSTSNIQLNKISLRPYISYQAQKDTVYTFKLQMPKIKTQDFINSLPGGLFGHFVDMKVKGEVAYHLNFKYNKNKPNDIVFDSKVDAKEVKITDYGTSELTKMNNSFTYRAIEDGVPQRPVYVGESNPYFTPLENISPYLQKCVLTSEDPSFYYHNGFVNEAFKQSIIKNIKTKKFARGASTISMQLVKNVFLTREKNLSRKLEEILLVYVLESQRISSKHRMFEVYFNIIEWGPNVYGIGEASQFYFQKSPFDLTLKESLFLASIIPSPKKYRWKFDNQGNLKPFAIQKHNFIKNLMLRRGLITSEDTIGYHANPLRLNGRSAHFIQEKDTTAVEIFDFDEIDY